MSHPDRLPLERANILTSRRATPGVARTAFIQSLYRGVTCGKQLVYHSHANDRPATAMGRQAAGGVDVEEDPAKRSA